MNVLLIAIGLVVLLAAQGIYYSVLWLGQRRRDALQTRLRSIATPQGASLLRDRRLARSAHMSAFLRSLGFPEWIEKVLLQTDLDTTVAVVLGIGLLLAAGLTFVLALLTKVIVLAFVIGISFGLAAPIFYLLGQRASRGRKLSEQLPDALDMMVRSLRAGHGVSAGIKLVASEMPVPVAVEFGRCFEELQMGSDFRDAVRNMTKRVPQNLDLRIFATSLIIQHETGGNLVEVLETISHTVRERFRFAGKLRALTTETRSSGYVLGALPFVTGAALAMIRPSYLEPLYRDPLGQALAVFGALLWIGGVLWMRRLSEVDY